MKKLFRLPFTFEKKNLPSDMGCPQDNSWLTAVWKIGHKFLYKRGEILTMKTGGLSRASLVISYTYYQFWFLAFVSHGI